MCWSKIVLKAGLPVIAALAVACQENLTGIDAEREGLVEIEASLSVDGLEVTDVKSILPEETIETRLSDVTLASYDSDGQLVNVLYYKEVAASMKLYLKGNSENNVYALANMGDMTASFPMDESDVGDIAYLLGSYDEVAMKGIPMCGVLKGCTSGNDKVLTVPLERLFAKLRTRILHTGLSGASSNSVYAYNLCNKSIYIRQANRSLKPFAESGSAAGTKDDILDCSDYNPDLADRNAYEGSLKPQYWGPGLGYFQDTTVVLYVPENVQGVLLPANADPFAKTADNISDIGGKAYDDLCTYLEFTANKPGKSDGYGGDITYRCYLGEDNVSDFSIRRNTRYDLTMNFTDEGFLLDNWKVFRGDGWLDTRTLCFVDEPYVVYPGTTVNVMVHYNRFSSSLETSSSGPVSDWVYEFDEEAMKASGLSCVFMGSKTIAGSNGYKDHYFKVTASADARTGTAFPITVAMADGTRSDVAVVHISEIGALTPVWDFCPEYVSQVGKLSVAGAVEGLLPLTVSVSDPSVLNCVCEDETTFSVTAVGEGASDIILSNKDGSQTLRLSLAVKAPTLKVSDIYVALAPDGEPGYLDYYYADTHGTPITNVDQAAYAKYLRPVVTGCDYLSMSVEGNSMKMYLGRLFSSGKQVGLGTYYDISISASACKEAGTHDMRAYVIDPFNGQPTFGLRRIDDYTLFTLGGVPSAVRNHFADENVWSDMIYEIPPVDADEAYVTTSLAPEWEGVFSNGNDVFRSEYDHSDSQSSSGASVTVGRNTVNSSMNHSAGRHDLKLQVRNRHSGEIISHTLGRVDVYVHTAIGAEATFGTLVCSAPSGGVYSAPTIAGVYNGVAGKSLYSTTSSSLIHYMDVYMEYMTDVSKVYVFSQMIRGVTSHTDIMDCLDVIRPSVSDGETSSNLRMLYSVCAGGGQRVAMCGEPYGQRKGIGTMLYRALYAYTYDAVQSEKTFKKLMLGYDEQLGYVSGPHAPCYTMHDMNKGSDMSANIVSKNFPYYFSPVSCKAYRDASGNGYHVIHTLNAIAPETCGWINLL